MRDPAKLKLYVDLDGVLVDFNKGYDTLVGGNDKRPPVVNGDESAFWRPIQESQRFWLDLEWTADGRELWHAVKHHPYVVLLTSPGSHDTEKAMRQKHWWVRREIGGAANLVFKHSTEKHFYACPNSILIDDWGANVRRWRSTGAFAIQHKTASNTLAELEALGLCLP